LASTWAADDPADAGDPPAKAGAPVKERRLRINGDRQIQTRKKKCKSKKFSYTHLTLLIDAQAISKISAATPVTSSPSRIRFLTSRYFRRPSPLSSNLSAARSTLASDSRTQWLQRE
jgi:hypothetical protein